MMQFSTVKLKIIIGVSQAKLEEKKGYINRTYVET